MDANKRNGPEFAPLREHVKSYPIKVLVKDKDGAIIREEKMDYGNHVDKSWLGRLSFWAWEAGHTVTTEKL